MYVTICRLYETNPEAMQIVEALQIAGVPAKDMSLISNNSDDWSDNETGAAAETKPSDTSLTGSNPAAAKLEKADTPSARAEGGLLGAAIGAAAGTAGTLIGSLVLLAVPGIGPAVGVGWLLGLMAAGAATGGATGGLLGALTGAGVREADAQAYAEGIRRGGSLVTARVQPGEVRRVGSLMDDGAVDIAERAADYRRSGWQSFDAAGVPYTAEQVRSERRLHQAA
jgi:hypothetical protein